MEPKDLIKESILKAATELMNQFGFGALNMSELARYSKITKQRLYYHFKTPEEVILLLAQRWGASGQSFSLKSLAGTHEVGPYKILEMNNAVFDWLKNDYALAKLGLVLFQSGHYIKPLKEFMRQTQVTGRERIKSFLIQNTVFQNLKKKQLEQAVASLHTQMYGTYFYAVTMTQQNEHEKLNELKDNCNTALRIIIDSYVKN